MKQISTETIQKELIALTSQLLIESGEPYKNDIKLSDSLQRRLGIDSLGRAELFQRIEKKFDVFLPDELLMEADTLQDIVNYLKKEHPKIKAEQKFSIQHHKEKTKVDPSKANTLLDVIRLYGMHAPDKPHIYFQAENNKEEVITYGDLLHRALKAAQTLKNLGLQENDTIAIMLPTDPGFFYAFFGVLLAGCIPVPIYPPFRMHMLEAYAKTEAKILCNAEIRALITFPKAEKLSQILKSFVPSLKRVLTLADLLQAKETNETFQAQANHFALIQYTSGSTSDPKGVLLSHANLLTNIRGYGEAVKIKPEDVTVSWLPLYHDMGLIGMWLGSLYYGIPLVLLTPFCFLNRPERWLWAIHRHRGTLSGGPNFGYDLCIKKIEPALIEGLDLSSWRVAANGAEKVYPHTLEDFSKKFGPYGFKRKAFLPVYGLAESTVALTIPPITRSFRLDYVDRKKFDEAQIADPVNENSKSALTFVSCGKAIKDHEVRIVDEQDTPLKERRVGFLQFKGPSSMQAYYNNPKATQQSLHDGWFDSGDLAYIADEEIFITGRSKDLIIKAGRNLYPAEIEELVGKLKGVRQGCVTAFSVSNTSRGTEKLIILAETKEKNKEKRRHIKDTIQEAISDTLDIAPDQIILLGPHIIPKTSSGKLQRAAAKKMFLKNQLKPSLIPPWFQIVKLFLQSIGHQFMFGLKCLARLLFTIYVAIVFVMTLLPFYLLSMVLKRDQAAKSMRWWAKLVCLLSFCPITIKGKAYLSSEKPLIFAANHASYIDSLLVLAFVPIDTRFVGKKELFNAPIIGRLMKRLDYLSIDRLDLSKGMEDTKIIEQALNKNRSIFIFPEGTFGYAKGLRPFRLGAFKIAANAGVKVCPIAINGSRTILRNSEKTLKPGRIKITISEPIEAKGSEWKDVIALRQEVHAKIAVFCGEPSLDLIVPGTVAPKF